MKHLSLLVLVLSVAAPAQAQLLQNYGVRLGANASKVTADFVGAEGEVDFERRVGFQVAAFVELFDTPSFSVLTELEYARRGYESETLEIGPDDPEPIATVTASTTLHYLSLPALARLRLPGERAIVPYALIGPRADLLVGRDPGQYEFSSATFDDEMAEALTEFSLSGVLGVGAAFGDVFGREVRVEARYGFGLTDLLPEGEALDVRNRGIDLSVGIAL
jgi:hypothetical protein